MVDPKMIEWTERRYLTAEQALFETQTRHDQAYKDMAETRRGEPPKTLKREYTDWLVSQQQEHRP